MTFKDTKRKIYKELYCDQDPDLQAALRQAAIYWCRDASIDSLKIRIPKKEVRVLDVALEDHYTWVNLRTGEECPDTDFKRNSLRIEHNGIKTKYLFENRASGMVLSQSLKKRKF